MIRGHEDCDGETRVNVEMLDLRYVRDVSHLHRLSHHYSKRWGSMQRMAPRCDFPHIMGLGATMEENHLLLLDPLSSGVPERRENDGGGLVDDKV